ncbi:MAG: hypothetical protein EBY07_17040 [Actinobacteria bacterium]|nr:hypothetical protein [Actinomycetota bacterium]
MMSILKSEHKGELVFNPDPSTWNEYERLYILEGVNYQENTFNFIGGPQPEHRAKLEAMANFKGIVIAVNVPIDLNVFNKRFGVDHVFPAINCINYAKHYGKDTRKLVRGDSHSLSVWKPGYGLDRTDGKTLFGFLKDADSLVTELNEKYDEVILYFGNIDLRFHLMRQDNPAEATGQLFRRYVEFAKKLNNATLVNLLPVENESRKLPGTGLYLKKPFFGTRQERMILRDTANRIMNHSGLQTLQWPDEWIDEDGMKMFEYMEPKQSVHLKPKYYMFANQFIK